MAQKELVFKLKFVDENGAVVEKTAESIKDINKSISDLKDELENTELGSEAWNELAEDLGKAENALEKTTEAINDTKTAQKGLGDQLTSAPGIVGKVSQSVKGLGQTFKALLANPVVAVLAAIVGALTLLFKAFTSTKAGGEAFDRVMAGIGAALDVLRDRVLKVGGAIVKFFSGDFKGAAEDMRGAFSGIGEEIASEFQQAMEIKKELQAITDATRELNKERARQNAEIAKAKLVINDETKSYEERQQALEEVRQAEISLAKQEEILAQRRYEAIKAQNALSDSSKEALDEEAAAYVALQTAQQASLQKQKELYDQQKALRDRQRAEQKAAADKRKGELQQLADLEEQLTLEAIDNAEEKAKREVLIQAEAQKKQLKELNASAEQGQRILLGIVRQTQEKITRIEEQADEERIQTFRSFRSRLLSVDLEYINLLEQSNEGFLDEVLNGLVETSNGYASIVKGIGYEVYDELNERTGQIETIVNKIRSSSKDSLERTKKMILENEEDIFIRRVKNEEANYQLYLDGARQREKIREKELQNVKDLIDAELAQNEEKYQKGEIDLNEYMSSLNNILEEQKLIEQNINDAFKQEELNREELHFKKLGELNRDYTNKQLEVEEGFADAKQKLRDAERAKQLNDVALVRDAFGALASLFSDNFEVNKRFSQAEALISTYLTAQQAYASQVIPGDPSSLIRAGVAAGIAVVQGLARVRQIEMTEPPKAADGLLVGQGSGRMDNMMVNVSNGESIINARSTQRFKPLLSAINEAGGGRRFTGGFTQTQTSPETNLLNNLVSNNQSPIKTYVVSTEVSSGISLDRQIKSRSVL